MKSTIKHFLTAIAITSLSFYFASPSQAGRAIFNQDTNTIMESLGYPQEKIVGWKTSVYTYQTPELKKLFPDFPYSKFSLIFQDDKLTSVTLIFDENDFTDAIYEKGYNYEQKVAWKFFNYLFGYQSTTWDELSTKFTGNETIYDYQYCLGDGVANDFTRWGFAQMTDYVVWHYDTRCE